VALPVIRRRTHRVVVMWRIVGIVPALVAGAAMWVLGGIVVLVFLRK
jgi:hypothetical protein